MFMICELNGSGKNEVCLINLETCKKVMAHYDSRNSFLAFREQIDSEDGTLEFSKDYKVVKYQEVRDYYSVVEYYDNNIMEALTSMDSSIVESTTKQEINRLYSHNEIFEKCLEYNGIIGCTHMIQNFIKVIYGVDLTTL